MPDLRDDFAIRFATVLVQLGHPDRDVPRRAYDLADAMLDERARRIEAEAIAAEPSWSAGYSASSALLDDVPSLPDETDHDELLDPSFEEPPYDPAWDVEKWSADPGARPGLARTRLEEPPEGGARKLA